MDKKCCLLLVLIVALTSYRSRAEANSGKCKMTVQAIAHSGKSDRDESMLRLENITPAAGSPLQQNSVLAVDFEYWIQDFEPDRYTIIPQFSVSPERGTAGAFPASGSPVLRSPAGRVHFCFPMAYVLNDHIEVPLNVHFLLNKFLADKWVGNHWTSVSVASTEHLLYPASK